MIWFCSLRFRSLFQKLTNRTKLLKSPKKPVSQDHIPPAECSPKNSRPRSALLVQVVCPKKIRTSLRPRRGNSVSLSGFYMCSCSLSWASWVTSPPHREHSWASTVWASEPRSQAENRGLSKRSFLVYLCWPIRQIILLFLTEFVKFSGTSIKGQWNDFSSGNIYYCFRTLVSTCTHYSYVPGNERQESESKAKTKAGQHKNKVFRLEPMMTGNSLDRLNWNKLYRSYEHTWKHTYPSRLRLTCVLSHFGFAIPTLRTTQFDFCLSLCERLTRPYRRAHKLVHCLSAGLRISLVIHRFSPFCQDSGYIPCSPCFVHCCRMGHWTHQLAWHNWQPSAECVLQIRSFDSYEFCPRINRLFVQVNNTVGVVSWCGESDPTSWCGEDPTSWCGESSSQVCENWDTGNLWTNHIHLTQATQSPRAYEDLSFISCHGQNSFLSTLYGECTMCDWFDHCALIWVTCWSVTWLNVNNNKAPDTVKTFYSGMLRPSK